MRVSAHCVPWQYRVALTVRQTVGEGQCRARIRWPEFRPHNTPYTIHRGACTLLDSGLRARSTSWHGPIPELGWLLEQGTGAQQPLKPLLQALQHRRRTSANISVVGDGCCTTCACVLLTVRACPCPAAPLCRIGPTHSPPQPACPASVCMLLPASHWTQ